MNRQPDPLALFPWVFALAIAVLVVPVALSSCLSLKHKPTVSSVVDKATRSYQSLYCQGLVPPDVAAQVAVQHLEYRRTMDTTHNAAVVGENNTKGAFIATKESASRLLDAVALTLTKHEVDELRSKLERATAP